NKTDDHLKLATVSWPKEPLESWLARAETQISTASVAAGSSYALPQISGAGCIDNTWTPTAGPPDARSAHTAVWTGSEMIVWGGFRQSGAVASGGRYNPGTDNWMPTSTTNPPEARGFHTAVWTGTEMIIWGGTNNSSGLNTGGRYSPSTNSWTA